MEEGVYLEDRLLDTPVGAHLHLQLHDVTARRSTHQPRAHVRIVFVHGAHIARCLVVVDDGFVVASPRGGKHRRPDDADERARTRKASGEHR
eukprot:60375-Prymnesium_polylepis.2